MKRLFSSGFLRRALLGVLLGVGSLLSSGCQPPTVDYGTQGFATLRVMNFAGYCNPPMDIYWDAVGETPAQNAKIYNLDYGGGAVYTTGILTGQAGTTYHMVARPTRDTLRSFRMRDYTFQAGKTYTWIITKSDANTYQDQVVEDHTGGTGANNAFIRFINQLPNTGNLALHVNDPNSTTLLTPAAGIGFNGVGSYFPMPVVQDVGSTFYLVDVGTGAVVARLVNQTPIAGSYYSIVYSGDLCRTPAQTPEDTVTDKLDTLRLRSFDDNNAGNDLTVPVPVSMRYNVINGIVDSPNPYGSYTSDTLRDSKLGFVFNALTLPQHLNFSIDPIAPLSVGGAKVVVNSQTDKGNPVYDVNFVNAELPNPLDIRVWATDGIADSTKHMLFEVPKADALQGLTAKNLLSDNNKSYTFFFADSVAPPAKNPKTWKGMVAQIPDVCPPTSIRLVFLPGIIRAGTKANGFFSAFWFQASGRGKDSSAFNLTGGKLTGFDFNRYDTSSVITGLQPGQIVPITISSMIGPANAVGYPPITVPDETFQAVAGGIYEVALVGTRANHKLLIFRTNPY